jgi:hypothetical protein
MPTVQELIKQTTLYTDDVEYVIVKLPSNAATVAASILAEISEPFLSIIVDKDEVTLILPVDGLEEFEKRLRDPIIATQRYRLITFDIVLNLETIGFMAEISRALAHAEVSIIPLAAFSRDHILVTVQHYDAAIQALHNLIK